MQDQCNSNLALKVLMVCYGRQICKWMIAIYRGRREARGITSTLVDEGMWSGRALPRQSHGKGKRDGSREEAGGVLQAEGSSVSERSRVD